MKEKAPAYQRYPKQILGDDKCLAMDWDAYGMHNWLLDISWQQTPRGTIPNDHAVLRRWLRSPSDDVWRRVWPQLSPSWPSQLDGRLGNLGMMRCSKRQENYRNGNKGKERYVNRSQIGTQIVRKNVEEEVVDFDSSKWVEAIHSSHPRPEGQAGDIEIIEAIERESRRQKLSHLQAAEYVHARTQLYAAKVKTWPAGELQFVTGAYKFFRNSIYNQDAVLWERKDAKQVKREADDAAIARSARDVARSHVQEMPG